MLTYDEFKEDMDNGFIKGDRWENGGRNPKDETVEKLAEIFGTSFEILKGRDDGLEEIVSLLKENNLTEEEEEEKDEIIKLLKDFLDK